MDGAMISGSEFTSGEPAMARMVATRARARVDGPHRPEIPGAGSVDLTAWGRHIRPTPDRTPWHTC